MGVVYAVGGVVNDVTAPAGDVRVVLLLLLLLPPLGRYFNNAD